MPTAVADGCGAEREQSLTECRGGQLLGGRLALSFDDELTAGGPDVAAAALANRHGQMMIGKNLREPIYHLV